jgi:hypothetical protein
MPLLQKNSSGNNFGTKNNPKFPDLSKSERLRSNPLLNVRREDIFYREDIKMTFVYALIGTSALAILGAFGYMGVQQLRK